MKAAVKTTPNAFVGKKEPPSDAELASVLGPAKQLWDKVVSALKSECPELVAEWKCSTPKLGWGLRLQQKQRNIVYLSPCKGSFRVGFVLGDKAVAAARDARLPSHILDCLATAPSYAEGTGVRFEITKEEVPAICRLARIKINN